MKDLINNSETQRMTSLQIAETTKKNHKEILRAIRNMEKAWENVNGRKFALVEYKDEKGQLRPCYSLTKTESLYIATKFNDEARARLILRWEALEKGEAKPIIQQPSPTDANYLTNRIMVAKFALEALNMNEVSKLAIVKSISKGYDLPLPEYAPSKGVLKCTTYLLKKIGADCSTRQFNEALIQMGMVQQNQRATPRGMRYFKSLTSEGLEFGENMVSPENPRETQIMLYEDKFSDLFEMYLDHIKF